MKKVLLKVFKWLSLLALVLAGIGLLLPAHYSVTRVQRINATTTKVQSHIDAPKEWLRWSPWNKRDPDMKITYSGPERGVGAKWGWVSKTEGNGEMEITAVEPGRRLLYTLKIEGMGEPSQGEMILRAGAGTTEVTWRMSGEHGWNPVHRWFAFLFMERFVGPDFEAGLRSLKVLAE